MPVNVMSVKSIDVNNQAPVVGSGGFFSNAKIKRFNEFYIKTNRLNSKGMEEIKIEQSVTPNHFLGISRQAS